MATSELRIHTNMSAALQAVQDETNVSSALMISTNAVQISPPADAPPGHALFVEAAAALGTAPSVVLHSRSTESAIRFTASGSDKAFHLGIGGNAAGPGTFFIFSDGAGVMFRIDQNGNVRIDKNLFVGGQLTVGKLALDPSQFAPQNVPQTTSGLKQLMIDPATGNLFMQ